MWTLLARNRGLVALRGVVGIVFGLLTLFNPAISLAVLVLLFGAYSLADGAFTTIAAVVNRREEPLWMSFLVSGLVGVAIGVITFVWPSVTALALLFLIAGWAVVMGIGEIFTAIRLRKLITGEWLLILVGVISVLFGVALFAFPGEGALAVVLWIGAFATVLGILRLVLAFRLRRWLPKRVGGNPAILHLVAIGSRETWGRDSLPAGLKPTSYPTATWPRGRRLEERFRPFRSHGERGNDSGRDTPTAADLGPGDGDRNGRIIRFDENRAVLEQHYRTRRSYPRPGAGRCSGTCASGG